MKAFFQGLVLGIAVMYGYLNYSADFFGLFREWFGGASENFQHERMRKETDKALHGLLLQSIPEGREREIIVRC